MKDHLLRLWTEEEGQDLTEYALLLVLRAAKQLERRIAPLSHWKGVEMDASPA
jgi:hypothetical protein